VILPLDVVSESAASPAARSGDSHDRRLAGMRVLVVDDSPVNLEVCQHILEREGARVGLASDGREAVERLRVEPQGFDVVLMDVHMPVLDGNEATRRIRGELGLQALPVIALTASALIAERDRALEAGMNDFVSKPFDVEALVRTVRRCAERARGRRGPTKLEAAVAPAQLPSDWPAIDGVDAADAFRRLGGDRALLLSVLRSLLKEFGDLAGENVALPVGDGAAALAARLHKLRGSAGLIGIDGVRQAAGAGEAALKAGDAGRAGQALRDLGTALRRLEASAQPHLNAANASLGTVDASPVDPEGLQLLIDALGRQDLAAMPWFDELGPSLRGALGPERFAALDGAIRALQFKQAVEILRGAAFA
jgi:CheY-like chemotaxis protein